MENNEEMSEEIDKKQEMFQRMYESNQEYLDKVIITTSVGSIPIMLNLLETLGKNNPILFSIILFLFGLIIILHVNGLMNARSGCENLTDKNTQIGCTQCNNAKLCDKIKEYVFLINIFIIIFTVILYVNNLKLFCKDYNIEQEQKTIGNLKENKNE